MMPVFLNFTSNMCFSADRDEDDWVLTSCPGEYPNITDVVELYDASNNTSITN